MKFAYMYQNYDYDTGIVSQLSIPTTSERIIVITLILDEKEGENITVSVQEDLALAKEIFRRAKKEDCELTEEYFLAFGFAEDLWPVVRLASTYLQLEEMQKFLLKRLKETMLTPSIDKKWREKYHDKK